MKMEEWDLFETTLRKAGAGIKESDGGDEFDQDIVQALL
jgi:hypothetical protein